MILKKKGGKIITKYSILRITLFGGLITISSLSTEATKYKFTEFR